MRQKKTKSKNYIIFILLIGILVGWIASDIFVSSYLGECYAGMTIDEINEVGFKPLEVPRKEYPTQEEKGDSVYNKYSRTPAGRIKGGNTITCCVTYNEEEIVESVRSDVVYASPLDRGSRAAEEAKVLAEFTEERDLENTEYVNYKTYDELNAFLETHPTWGLPDALIRKDRGSEEEEADYLSYYIWDEEKTVTYFFVAASENGTTKMRFEQILKSRR